MHVTTTPTLEGFTVVSSHKSEKLAVSAAARLGLQEILFQPPSFFFPARWYVLRPKPAATARGVAS